MSQTRRDDNDIIRDILGCYCDLSPENLACDGERSRTQVRTAYAQIQRHLKALFAEIGRTVSESEAYRLGENLPPSTENWMDALKRKMEARQPRRKAPTTDGSAISKLGLPDDIVSRKFTFRRKTYEVTGLQMSNRKYPVLCTRQPDGKRFKFPVSDVLAGLTTRAA